MKNLPYRGVSLYLYPKEDDCNMKDSALSIANYFIEIAHNHDVEIKPLRLMKLVYIAHGFMLAIMNRSVLNPRFDKVEAWKYGPVIPSVYHSFKIYGNNPITKKTTVFTDEEVGKDIEYKIVTPQLEDKEAKQICNFVFNRYEKFSDWDLVKFLHKPQSPWGLVYEEGKNNEIPDLYTKIYFKKLYNSLIDWAKNERNK